MGSPGFFKQWGTNIAETGHPEMTQQRLQKQDDDLKAQMAPHVQAMNGLRTEQMHITDPKTGLPIKGYEQQYNELTDQMQGHIHALRGIAHPDHVATPLDNFRQHLTDRMHITNGLKRANDQTRKQDQGEEKDRSDTQTFMQGSPALDPAALNPDEQHEANRIKSNMDPKAGTEKTGSEKATWLPGPDGQQHPFELKDGKYVPVDTPEGVGAPVPKPTADHAPITKTLLVNGKAHVVAWNPETKKFDRDMGEAPPTYAQIAPGLKGWELSARTMVQQGDDGLPHVFQFNPSSRQYEETGGIKLSGTASNQAFQGAAIQKLGSKIINDIQSNKELMGNLSSYATQYLNGTPISDPAAATLIADLESFSSTQPALHGFRSRTAQQAFSKILGGLANNPEATISTIKALSATASTFTNLATPEGPKTKELRSTSGGTIIQHSKSTGKYRYSTDGGKTWQPGQPQSQTTGKQ